MIPDAFVQISATPLRIDTTDVRADVHTAVRDALMEIAKAHLGTFGIQLLLENEHPIAKQSTGRQVPKLK